MAKVATDGFMDARHDVRAGFDEMDVCAGQPTSYADIAVRSLANHAMTGGDYTKADGSPDGRQQTIAQQADVPCTAGNADHVVLKNTTTQEYEVTTCALTVLGAGTVTVGSYIATDRDPT